MAARTSTNPRSTGEVTDGLPAVLEVSAGDVAAAAAEAGTLVVLDDDPTGTQTIADLPIITAWEDDDVRWALSRDTRAFFVLTNSRSLSAAETEARVRAVVSALARVAAEQNIRVVLVSRSDSTLRGHFPLETDVLVEASGVDLGRRVDGVVIAPAYVDAGRITVDSTHWVRAPGGYVMVGESEFARDSVFGYTSSDLRDYVAEKTGGRWSRDEVASITVEQLRAGVSGVAEILRGVRDARPVVVDAVVDDDLRVLALAALQVEREGRSFVYRVGPSFVRARTGQEARPPLDAATLGSVLRRAARGGARVAAGGLVIVGSHVGLTTRQLAQLETLEGITSLVVDVRRVLDRNDESVGELVNRALAALEHGDLVVSTSREVLAARDRVDGLEIAARVSEAVVAIVVGILERSRPRWIVAKGGITSSDIATRALGARRAWARGTMLPGIVSLWEPVGARHEVPFVVFAGNVGDDGSLADVVGRLRAAG